MLTGTAERQAEARDRGPRLPAAGGPDHRPVRAAGGPAARGLGAGQGDPGGGRPIVFARSHPRAVRGRRAPGSPRRSVRSSPPSSATSSTWPTRSPSGTVTSAVRRCTSRCPSRMPGARSNCCTSAIPSQHGRDWWDDEVFLGLARLRGMECRAAVRRGCCSAGRRRSLLRSRRPAVMMMMMAAAGHGIAATGRMLSGVRGRGRGGETTRACRGSRCPGISRGGVLLPGVRGAVHAAGGSLVRGAAGLAGDRAAGGALPQAVPAGLLVPGACHGDGAGLAEGGREGPCPLTGSSRCC